MVKPGERKDLGKRRVASADGRRRNGAAAAAAALNSDIDEKDQSGTNGDTGSSLSHSTANSAKKPVNKRKGRSSVRFESEDSDDLPLNNGNKETSIVRGASSSTPLKRRSSGKPKPSSAAKNGKKAAAENSDDEGKQAKSPKKPEAEAEYEVEAIVGQKTVKGATFFLVRWKGYSEDEDTWMPENDLHCDTLLEQFRAKQEPTKVGSSKKPGVRGRPLGGAKKAAAPADPKKEWVVERIVDFNDDDKGGLYRVRWKGFGAKDDTWEPESNLSCDKLIEKYKRELITQKNVETKELRESPKKTKRLVNEQYPRTNLHNRIERTSKRASAKNRIFYGED